MPTFIVHIAAPAEGNRQVCLACGRSLTDRAAWATDRAANGELTWWRAGQLVAVRAGTAYLIDANVGLQPYEKLCSAAAAADSSDEPVARVTKAGRWLYKIAIHDGISVYGHWWVWGLNRAIAKGALELGRYLDIEPTAEWNIRKPDISAGAR